MLIKHLQDIQSNGGCSVAAEIGITVVCGQCAADARCHSGSKHHTHHAPVGSTEYSGPY